MFRLYSLLLFLTLAINISIAQESCNLHGVIVSSLLIDPSGPDASFDTNKDGLVNSNDEYIELCNTSDSLVSISNWSLGDDDLPPYPDYSIPLNTHINPGECIVLVANYCMDDTTTCILPSHVIDMQLPFLGLLGNSGDVIQLMDNSGMICAVSYGNTMCEDVDSLALPGYSEEHCDFWGQDIDGCPLLMQGDSCSYIPGPLPLIWLEFKGRQTAIDEIQLDWKTRDELDNLGFEILWKNQIHTNYKSCGFIPSESFDSEFHNYSFIHNRLLPGRHYYKIRQVDLDGRSNYSKEIVVQLDNEEDLNIFPNPVRNRLYISTSRENIKCTIYNSKAEIILEKVLKKSGEFLDLSLLPKGFYVLRTGEGNQVKHIKFVKI